MNIYELRKHFQNRNNYPIGTFMQFGEELKRHGVWRANLVTMYPNITDNLDLLGMVIVEIPPNAWDKIEKIKHYVMPAGFYVQFRKMENPLKTKKYTYTQEFSNDKIRSTFT